MKLILALLVCFTIFSCGSNSQPPGALVVFGLKDSCYNLQDSVMHKPIAASRELEIIQNTLEDTVVLGFAIVAPGYTGKFRYLGGYDPDISDEQLPKLSKICVGLYQRRPSKGKLIIKYLY